jgi:His-Xaa-Ser system radical SAM maturase HxsB
MAGEHLLLSETAFLRFTSGQLSPEEPLYRTLAAKHFLASRDDPVALELLALKVRTRLRHLPESTGLHIFVVTLRCEHSCPYCQVSRQTSSRTKYDMSQETARRALEMAFRSPSPALKIEFQGGEPLLNFEMVLDITRQARELNRHHQKHLSFVVATNLALLSDEHLAAAAEHDLHFSTSLDGPRDLHNANRPRAGGDSWERAVAGIRRIRRELGPHRVSALMTTTGESLRRVRDIVDTYVAEGLEDLFLRPLSPYGFAMRSGAHDAYATDDWLNFYKEGLDYILALNQRGTRLVERFATIILRKAFSNVDPRYVDLMSPAGIGIAALVYNYDGRVYASDEGRMLAEMGDNTFCLGDLQTESYQDIFLSDALLDPLEESFALSAPMCTDCGVREYCGADPVYHHATAGDFVGIKPTSGFCRRNMGVIEHVLTRFNDDPDARRTFRSWIAWS